MTTDINTRINTDISQRHDTIAAVMLGALVGLAALAALLGRLLDAFGHPLLAGLALTLTAAVGAAGRWVARRVRERREDAADTLAGVAWRAERMPHLAAQIDTAQIGSARIDTARLDRDRAGVA